MKPAAQKQPAFKCVLLAQPALDPPASTIAVGRGSPAISSMLPHEHGILVTTGVGRQYIIPWSNVRHAELKVEC